MEAFIQLLPGYSSFCSRCMEGSFFDCISGVDWLKLKGSNEEAGKAALLHRTTCLRLAATGKYEGEEETSAKMESLFIENHSYWAY